MYFTYFVFIVCLFLRKSVSSKDPRILVCFAQCLGTLAFSMNTEWMNEWEKQIEKENVSENEPYDQERPWWWAKRSIRAGLLALFYLEPSLVNECSLEVIFVLYDRGLAHNQAALNRMCEMKANA